MATIAENLQTIIDIKADIKTAIENKGVTVGDAGFGEYASKIDSIKTEGFDFEQIGYNQEAINFSNELINNDILYSKQLYDAWDPSRTNTYELYRDKSELVYAPLIDTSNVTDMGSMFYDCRELLVVPLFDTSKVNSMNSMFYRCSSLTIVPQFDTSKVTDMGSMFYYCSKLTSVPLFDTSNVTSMYQMFMHCNDLTSIPLFDTSNVTSMNSMFYGCSSLTSVPLFDTSKVTIMHRMFNSCSKLTSVSLFDTSNVTNVGYMFEFCNALTDVGGFINIGQSFSGSDNTTFDFAYSPLTHESCMNIINNVYDMNLNTNYTGIPTLRIRSTTYNLLSADDIAIATSKGWTVKSYLP